jgi:membrane protein required for colicin V production
MTIALTDWLLLAVLLVSLVVGFWRGLIDELLSLAGWVVAFVVAQWWAPEVLQWLPFLKAAADSVQYAVAFALVFVGTLLAFAVLTLVVKKMISGVGLRPLDRTLGGVFGLLRGLLFLLALTVAVQWTGLSRDAWWTAAQGPAWLEQVLTDLKPLLPSAFVDYLP